MDVEIWLKYKCLCSHRAHNPNKYACLMIQWFKIQNQTHMVYECIALCLHNLKCQEMILLHNTILTLPAGKKGC